MQPPFLVIVSISVPPVFLLGVLPVPHDIPIPLSSCDVEVNSSIPGSLVSTHIGAGAGGDADQPRPPPRGDQEHERWSQPDVLCNRNNCSGMAAQTIPLQSLAVAGELGFAFATLDPLSMAPIVNGVLHFISCPLAVRLENNPMGEGR